MKTIKKRLDFDFIKKWTKKGLNPIALSVLYRREIIGENDLLDFFLPSFENIIQPFEFKQIVTAYERLDRALKNNEKIIIFGDRDVDGTTSVSILYSFLKKITDKVFWEVPIGEDVYGLDINKFKKWKENSYSLCITVDCGVTNVKEVEELKKCGIDTIIIDHHKPLDVLPDCVSIINPKCESNFVFTDIAACGVVFIFVYGFLIYRSDIYNKTIAVIYNEKDKFRVDLYKNFVLENSTVMDHITQLENIKFDKGYLYTNNNIKIAGVERLSNNFQKDSFINLMESQDVMVKLLLFKKLLERVTGIEMLKEQYMPVAMFGLIADVMPIVKTNRIIVKLGMDYLRKKKNLNLVKLFEKLNLDINTFSSKDIAWGICPVLNASGRMGQANETVNFLISESNIDDKISLMLANNEQRKKKSDEAYNIFIDDLSENKRIYDNKLTFFYSEKITRGITGITATKISNQINCPVIVAAKEGEFYTGSMRGKANIHLVDFLNNAKEILDEFGGHKDAAGFRFHKSNLPLFIDFLKRNSNLFNIAEEKEEEVIIDAEIPFEYLNNDLFKILGILEPFGEANPSPVFFTENLSITNYIRMGKQRQHLKVYFKTVNNQLPAVFWNKGEWFESLHKNNNRYNVFYNIELNKYNDQIIPQLNIVSLVKAGD